jgi:hypothetical protein
MRSKPQQQQMATRRANNKNIKGVTHFKGMRAFCPKILSPAQTRPARLSEDIPLIQLGKFIVLANSKLNNYNNTVCRPAAGNSKACNIPLKPH